MKRAVDEATCRAMSEGFGEQQKVQPLGNPRQGHVNRC